MIFCLLLQQRVQHVRNVNGDNESNYLTCITCDPAPWRNHGQQPFKHDSFNVPESGAVPYSQRLKQDQVDAVGWDGCTIVEEHKHETCHRLEQNPAQFAGPVQELCHPDTHRLKHKTHSSCSIPAFVVYQRITQGMCVHNVILTVNKLSLCEQDTNQLNVTPEVEEVIQIL